MSPKIQTELDLSMFELTDEQFATLESVAASHGIDVGAYIKWTIQDHAQELIDTQASQRRMGLSVVNADDTDSEQMPEE